MAKYIVEFTALVFRDEETVEAECKQDAYDRFMAENPGIADGNGRIVSIRPEGTDAAGSFASRLANARSYPRGVYA